MPFWATILSEFVSSKNKWMKIQSEPFKQTKKQSPKNYTSDNISLTVNRLSQIILDVIKLHTKTLF